MKMIIRIAVGVFLGLAAFVVVRAIPDQVQGFRENQAWNYTFGLTPDRIIEKCGAPLKDESDRYFRRLLYEPSGRPIEVRFSNFSDDVRNPQIDDPRYPLKDATSLDRLKLLPCLMQ